MVDRGSLRVGITKSLGNYESFRVDVEYSADAKAGERPERMFDRISKIVHLQLAKQIEEFLDTQKIAKRFEGE